MNFTPSLADAEEADLQDKKRTSHLINKEFNYDKLIFLVNTEDSINNFYFSPQIISHLYNK